MQLNPILLLLLSAAFISALLGCGSPPSSIGPVPSQYPLQDTFSRVTLLLPEIRDLELLSSVEPKLLSKPEMANYLTSHLDEAATEELADLQALYLALGLIDERVDLYSLYVKMLAEQVRGTFDPETQELYVLKGAVEELILVHETVHALQQQHFDILAKRSDASYNLDQKLAFSALVEGDATLTTRLYQESALPHAVDSVSSPIFDNAPPIVQASLTFPYLQGAAFVSSLWDIDQSWTQVEAAYVSPPQSTEHVLHPEKFLAGEAPTTGTIPELLPYLEGRWTLVFRDVLGEFLLGAYLDSILSTEDAQRAAGGWAGDRFALYRNPDGLLAMVIVIQWDADQDIEEFFDAYEAFTDQAAEWQQKEFSLGAIRWQAPQRWVHLGRSEDWILIVLAPSKALLQDILSQFPNF
jgi:hypothetical protein